MLRLQMSNMRDRQKFKFVASDPDGLPQNRKKTLRACAPCRKRKRRCTHNGTSSSRTDRDISGEPHPSSSPTREQEEPIEGSAGHQIDVQSNAQPSPPETRIDGESWFVGDLDPEGAFIVAASPESSSRSTRRHGDVGVWLSARNAYSQLAVKRPRSSLASSLDPFVSSVFLPYLEDQCLGVIPGPDDMKDLLDLYLRNIHPMFPVLDYDAYQLMPDTSPDKILLSQAICLATSVDRDAKRYLRLPTVRAPDCDVSRSLLDAINTSISLGLVRDKVVLIQALSLASLFTQFSGNRQESAELFSRAICHTYTIGLHHHFPSSIQKEKISARLFCCLYALDVLTAAFLGIPMQLHRRDTNRDISACIAAQDGCFQLFLRTIHLMERVIELYQPAVNSTWKEEFPPFEDLMIEAGTPDIPIHFIATIEVLYHSAAILSCRSANPDGVSPTTESKLRRSLSASRVTSIVGEEFHNELCPFPVIPYAVALSLRVSYQNLQQAKAEIFQKRARRQLASNCRLLRELGEVFYSASLMANLGEYLIEKGDGQQEPSVSTRPQYRGDADHRMSGGNNKGPSSENFPLPNNQPTEAFETTYQPYETSFFDPMPSLGIFDNFDFDFGMIGNMNQEGI